MALFNKIKKLLSEPEKTSSVPETEEPAEAGTPDGESEPADLSEENPGETDLNEDTFETALNETDLEVGSKAYFLYEVSQNRALSSDHLPPEAEVSSALEAIRSRLELGMPESSADAQEPESPADTEKPDISADAKVRVFTDSSRMTGFAYCLAPAGEGAHITEDAFTRALRDYGIVHGTDRDTISKIVEERLYYRLFIIARATAPVKGKDGQVIDHFAREQELHLQEDERGNVDYKNTNIFQSVRAGEVVCDLVYPEDGIDGRDIMGKLLPAEKGAMPPVPKGKNISVSKDGLALVADEDGDISFQHGLFRVEPRLVIPGNVDNSTGNVRFAGDIVIQGDIRSGFEVTAGGTLTVTGLAEGAVLSAKGDIILEKGMRGNGAGSITTEGSVYSCFLEQAKIFAKGSVHSDVIINCNIQSGGDILAVSGKGILMGGTLKASGCVEAKRIGSRSETNTIIKIGVPIKETENIDEVRKKLNSDKETLDTITRNYNYLSQLDVIPDKHKDTLNILSKQKALYEELVSQLQEELYALEHQKKDYSKCRVRGEIIYAITDISLNNCSVSIRDSSNMCNVYYSKKERDLVIGTY